MARDNAKIAVFWDESYLWGLIAYRTFLALGIDFALLSAVEIGAGRLDEGFDIVFVPGGWAHDKMARLGERGSAAIKDFVHRGGGYLGFCGGAGLALSHESGLGLAPFGRLLTAARLPSFNGPIELQPGEPSHPLWRDIAPNTAFYAWWPGQFDLRDAPDVRVLAAYGQPQPGSFVTDLPTDAALDWSEWEKLYGINLDPTRLTGEPAVVETAFGSGKVVLSYLHFETPWHQPGYHALLNLIEYLSGKSACDGACPDSGSPAADAQVSEVPSSPEAQLTAEMEATARAFIDFGATNFLWYWRNDWLLEWRRGVRGIEYSTLYGLLRELDRLTRLAPGGGQASVMAGAGAKLSSLHAQVQEFFSLARQLIIQERYAMNYSVLSPLKSDDAEILRLREILFSTSKRCGGLYREILTQVDAWLLPLLRSEMAGK